MKRIILIALTALMAVSASASEFQTAAPAVQTQKKAKNCNIGQNISKGALGHPAFHVY